MASPSSSNDVQRFERIVLPHLDDAYTLARYLLRDQHDAQDAVQDAVLRALRYFETYREGDARAWLLAIVRNCCLTRHRKARVERANIALVEDVDVVHEAAGRATDARAVEQSERAALQRALDGLPAEFREVIVLREVQGLSYREISEATELSISNVGFLIHTGLKKIRERMQRDGTP